MDSKAGTSHHPFQCPLAIQGLRNANRLLLNLADSPGIIARIRAMPNYLFTAMLLQTPDEACQSSTSFG